MKILWECVDCGDVNVSDSEEHHTVETCECGAAFVDLEEYHVRRSFAVNVLDDNYNDAQVP